MQHKSKILLLLPDSLTYLRLAQEALGSINFDDTVELELKQISIEKIADNVKTNMADITIVRSLGARIINKQVPDVPIITIELENMDLLEAVYQLHTSGAESIALIDYAYNRNVFNLDFIKKVLGINIKSIFLNKFKKLDEIDEILSKAHDARVDAVVSQWVYIANEAQRYGFKSGVVYCNKNKIVEAIIQANNIVKAKAYEKKEKVKFATILNNVNESILVVNKYGTITNCNPRAQKTLNAQYSLLDECVLTLPSAHILRKLYGNGNECENEFVHTDQNAYVVTRKRIDFSGIGLETIILFQPVEHIVNIEKDIRKELHHKGFTSKYKFEDIIGKSYCMKQTINEAFSFSHSDATVLIYGESGTGKELLAHGIHKESNRTTGPFVPVNCASLPKTLVESELFGYEEGAFTGAQKGGKPGLFELAHRGTIFIDEIGELDPNTQVKLLRVLQEQEVIRLGGRKIIPINTRIIAATNKDLQDEIIKGKFRKDLYYRINVLMLQVPPLRERLDDVPLLFNHFIKEISTRLNVHYPSFKQDQLDVLKRYNWPGNVRELQNFAERYLAIGVDTYSLDSYMKRYTEQNCNSQLHTFDLKIQLGTLKDMEQEIIKQAQKIMPVKMELADRLGISRQALWKKMRKFNIDEDCPNGRF